MEDRGFGQVDYFSSASLTSTAMVTVERTSTVPGSTGVGTDAASARANIG